MSAQTIHAQVEELTGTESLVSLDDWAGDALDKLVMILPYEILIPFGSTESCTYTGSYTELTAKNKRILEVLRAPSAGSLATRRCDFVTQAEYSGRYLDTNSLHYPSDYDPKWTILADTIKVSPAVAGMVVISKYIALVGTLDTTGTALTTLPYTCEYLIVLDLAARVTLTKIQALVFVALTSSAVAPTSPTLATVTYSNAVAGTVATISFGVIPSAPTYTVATIPAGYATALSAFDTAMTSEDIELAIAQANKAKEYLDQYQLLVQEGNQSFQSAVKKFEGDVTKLVEQAKIDMEEAQAEGKMTHDANLQNAIQTAEAIYKNNMSLIQKYQQDVTLYVQKVQTEVGVYQMNVLRVNAERERYFLLYQAFKQEYHEQLFLKFGIQTVSSKNEK